MPSGINVTATSSGQIVAPVLLTSLIYLSSVERVREPAGGVCPILILI